ncbi:MAG: flagellar motor switch protein FliM [Deltaproteobacteria bacterium]|nr:flagellar motor switch protein FliM [Deltaproteobacteria bacterium]
MTEQILSQEEIDSLLGAMDSGKIDLNLSAENRTRIEPYDITSQSVKLPEHFQILGEICDRFAAFLRTSLSSTLQRKIDVKFVSSDIVNFEVFMEKFSNPTDFTLFNMDPLIGSGMFAIEPSLVFPLIDCMFGGSGKPLENTRDEFTILELRMMQKVANELLDCFQKAWKDIYPLELSFNKIETKPEFIHLVGLNELTVIIVFALNAREFSGNIHLCISNLMLEPIKDKLSSKYLRERDGENKWMQEIKELVSQAQITITGELGRATFNIKEILNLQVNDVISLNTGPKDPVIVTIEEVPKYHGFPGIYKGNSSVKITEMIDQNGG